MNPAILYISGPFPLSTGYAWLDLTCDGFGEAGQLDLNPILDLDKMGLRRSNVGKWVHVGQYIGGGLWGQAQWRGHVVWDRSWVGGFPQFEGMVSGGGVVWELPFGRPSGNQVGDEWAAAPIWLSCMQHVAPIPIGIGHVAHAQYGSLSWLVWLHLSSGFGRIRSNFFVLKCAFGWWGFERSSGPQIIISILWVPPCETRILTKPEA